MDFLKKVMEKLSTLGIEKPQEKEIEFKSQGGVRRVYLEDELVLVRKVEEPKGEADRLFDNLKAYREMANKAIRNNERLFEEYKHELPDGGASVRPEDFTLRKAPNFKSNVIGDGKENNNFEKGNQTRQLTQSEINKKNGVIEL